MAAVSAVGSRHSWEQPVWQEEVPTGHLARERCQAWQMVTHLGVAVPLGALGLDAARVPRDAVRAAAAAAVATIRQSHIPAGGSSMVLCVVQNDTEQ